MFGVTGADLHLVDPMLDLEGEREEFFEDEFEFETAAERIEDDRREREMQALLEAGVIHQCRVCGCTELSACEGGCIWATEDLCSRCA